jgi:hypothetical protein
LDHLPLLPWIAEEGFGLKGRNRLVVLSGRDRSAEPRRSSRI